MFLNISQECEINRFCQLLNLEGATLDSSSFAEIPMSVAPDQTTAPDTQEQEWDDIVFPPGDLWSDEPALESYLHLQQLRFFSVDGQLVPTPEEAAGEAEALLARYRERFGELPET
jgi:hypothetical protein